MSSGASKPTNKGGGILRSPQQKINGVNGGSREDHASGRVTFSSNGEDDDSCRSRRVVASSQTTTINRKKSANDGGYDSDEVEDAIMASGDAFSAGKRHKTGEDDIDVDDAAVRTSAEIEEARRRRGRVRRREDHEPRGDLEGKDVDDHDEKDDRCMSLITDQGADPDAYESNAAENAACPVEPFNMEAEKEGGLGFFDGETYVFRHNNKPVDGEEDAWLDGFGDDKEGGKGEGGGLDSTSIWKPREAAAKGAEQRRKDKFVNEDTIPEDLGRRVVTLLKNDDETVMAALTRHGASLRELQAQEQKIIKKARLKRRKPPKNQSENGGDESSKAPAAPDMETKQLKKKMEETRDTVEELTELADALLFGGEADAYDLTKSDWMHRFKLVQCFPPEQKKRSPEADVGDIQVKKKSCGYFEDASSNANETSADKADTQKPQHCEVMWEYKGNEDGAIHGPYTSRQMFDWTSCGYFVGENAVDIRRVGKFGHAPEKHTKQKSIDEVKTDVDDLMADLMDDDDEGETKTETEGAGAAGESSWMRSDRVDFSLYL